MKPNKILNSLTALALLGGVFSALLCGNKNTTQVKADAIADRDAGAEKYGFDTEAVYSTADDFKVTIQEATTTETSQAYTLKFMSSVIASSTATSPYNNVYIASNDSSIPADKEISTLTCYDFDPADPDLSLVETDENGEAVFNEDGTYKFKADSKGVMHDYKFKIPTYDGYVYRITPSDTQETIVIPYLVNRSNRYLIRVTEIGANVFNHRYQQDGTEKTYFNSSVKNIFVGKNIETICEGAFDGITADFTGVSINLLGSSEDYKCTGSWNGCATTNFNYNLDDAVDDGILEAKTVKNLKQVYDMSNATDDDGNTLYYDENGVQVSEDGYYLNKDGTKSENKYDGDPQTARAAKTVNFNQVTSFVSKDSFAFGDIVSGRPMVLEYGYTKPGSEDLYVGYYEFPLGDEQDGMGASAGIPNSVKYVDIHINKGEVIDPSSLVIRNIFKDGSGSGIDADTSSEYQSAPEKGYSAQYSIDQFINIKKQSVRRYGNYTAFSLTVDKVDDIYPQLNSSSWNQYKSKVESGNMKIRYLFTAFANSTYEITYLKDGKLVTKDVSFNKSAEKGLTLNFHQLTKDRNNVVTFLLKNKLIDSDGDFNSKTVKRVEYKDVSFKLDLMSTKKGTTQTVTKSDVVTRFGYLDILSEDTVVNAFSADLFLIIASVAYLAVYVIAATAYYFYAKNKYRNDEFRRMNTKKYLKKAAIRFFGGALVYLALVFIVLRFGFFNVSVIVYNPLDPMVVVLGVIGIVVLGVFIKNVVMWAKAEKVRRKALKLKLNEDVAEDGTK